MKISGFTFIRNGFTFGYPFVQSIQSLLPLVDELVVVVGDSTDGTREAIAAINNPKIKIIDTKWDDALRTSGKIFAQQTNIALDAITGDWAIYLQSDEVFHQTAHTQIKDYILKADKLNNVDGLFFPFLHFWGNFGHIRNTRAVHRGEIRVFKNTGNIRSYKDAMGFRKYENLGNYDSEKGGTKLNVLKTEIPVFHYSYSRNPALMKKKLNHFHRFWHDDKWLKEKTDEKLFDFNEVDRLEEFTGEHPVYMKELIAAKDWAFMYNPSKSNMKLKEKILNGFENLTGYRLFEYKNYRVIKS